MRAAVLAMILFALALPVAAAGPLVAANRGGAALWPSRYGNQPPFPHGSSGTPVSLACPQNKMSK